MLHGADEHDRPPQARLAGQTAPFPKARRRSGSMSPDATAPETNPGAAALRAPDHGKLITFRFDVVRDDGLERLGGALR
jgi:hypothetical protein